MKGHMSCAGPTEKWRASRSKLKISILPPDSTIKTVMDLPRETILNGIHHCPDNHRYGSFSFAHEEEDPYFVTHSKPDGLDSLKTRADDFIRLQCSKGRSVVLVTSGGSTVPLEVNLPRNLRRMH